MDTSKGEENPQHATINNQGDSENMEKSDDGDGKKEGKHHVTFGGTEAQSVAIEIANPKSQDNKLGANSSQTGTSDPVHTGRIRSITAKVLAGAGVARSALSAIQAKLGKFSSLVLGQLSAGRIKLTSPQLLAKRSVVDKIETHEKQAAEMQRMQSCFVRVLEALGLRKSVLEVMHERLKEAIRNEFNIVEHTWEIDTVCQYYKTDREKGLPLPQAELHLEKWGPNKISPPKETHWLIKYLKSYTDLFAVLLMIAGVFCIAVYVMDPVENHVEIYLGFALFSVVFFSVTFDFVQRSKSAKVMEGLKKLLPSKTTVMRDGQCCIIDAHDLVPGDLVQLRTGDRVPADIRLLTANQLKVDNSAFSGEQEPVERNAALAVDTRGDFIFQPLEASNLCFYSTTVFSGSGTGIVIATGDRTMMGNLAKLTADSSHEETPIGLEIAAFVKLIGGFAFIFGIGGFVLGILLGQGFMETLFLTVGIIVANVPEGLMATMTVSLGIAAKKMYDHNVLVKNLQAVETLGSTSVIASDKTGTLTQNVMTVQHCWYDEKLYATPVPKNVPEWKEMVKRKRAGYYDPQDATFKMLHLVAALCNNSQFTGWLNIDNEILKPEFDLGSAQCSSDPTEQGLLKFAVPIRSCAELRNLWPKMLEIPFNSNTKFQLSIHRNEDRAKPPVLMMKGAPERVFDKCRHLMVNGKRRPLDEDLREGFAYATITMAQAGERVLGFAVRDLDGFPADFEFSSHPEPNFPVENLTFVGLISLIDPPREGVAEAVRVCQRAGIKVFMVTGDHPVTAEAIAKKVGILENEKIEDGKATTITGDNIRSWLDMDEEAQIKKWDTALSHEQIIFARVSPAHKLLIVEHCQRLGHIVAVTGDGVNDAPALKKADVGVAMGKTGRDLSRDAADLILMDDNFASIVAGVERGRVIFDNLKKTISYTLTMSFPQLIPFLLHVLLNFPQALPTVLMLVLCLGTDLYPAIALAYEEGEEGIMKRPPRNAKTGKLVTWRLLSHAYLQIAVLETLAGLFAYFVIFGDYGYPRHILYRIGEGWEHSSVLCTTDSNNIPKECGFGCNTPNYKMGLPTPVKYCEHGCKIPMPGEPLDPFSEFDYNGFRGKEFCSLTCLSFPLDQRPAVCGNLSDPESEKLGFPGRGHETSNPAPVGAFYWWGGRQMTFPNVKYQHHVNYFASTGYFVAIIVAQFADLMICKTRKLSIFGVGLNKFDYIGLAIALLIALLLAYVPPLQYTFLTRPLFPYHWLLGLPLAFLIFWYGELRKLCIRRSQGGYIERVLFW